MADRMMGVTAGGYMLYQYTLHKNQNCAKTTNANSASTVPTITRGQDSRAIVSPVLRVCGFLGVVALRFLPLMPNAAWEVLRVSSVRVVNEILG